MAPPISFGLGFSLARAGGAALDADAAAYIAAVKAAGGTVSGTQTTAINDFIKAEKAASRWTLHKRIYLPIWAVAAANAIDMVTRASGTFVGGVTHAAGYIQSNRTTGYFNMGVSPSTLGITNSSGAMGALISQADSTTGSAYFLGARGAAASGECAVYQVTGTIVNSMIGRVPTVPVASLTVVTRNGILYAVRNSSGLRGRQRLTSGVIESSLVTGVATDPITTREIYGCAENADGSPTGSYTDARIGAWFVGLGDTFAVYDAFTANLKTLWEQCSGLTLP